MPVAVLVPPTVWGDDNAEPARTIKTLLTRVVLNPRPRPRLRVLLLRNSDLVIVCYDRMLGASSESASSMMYSVLIEQVTAIDFHLRAAGNISQPTRFSGAFHAEHASSIYFQPARDSHATNQ